jgi:hypothetical protein
MRELFFVFGEHAVDSINGRVTAKLLKFILHHKPADITVEDNIVSHAHFLFIVLVVLTLTTAVGQLP